MLKLIKDYLKLSIFARKSFKKEHEKLKEMEKEYESR